MKKNILIIALAAGSLFSCQDFLQEEMVATLTQERYNSPEGIEELVNGAYEGLRFHHNYEWSYALTNYGTDEFTNGGGVNHVMYNTYTGLLNPAETMDLRPLWDNMYAQINVCNIGIQNIPEVYTDPNSATTRDTRLGEVLFLRGFNYLKLVEQFGAVPMKLTPTQGDEANFPRATVAENVAQIISDLRRAEELLPPTAAQVGRITKSAAQHYLAKAYLFRASERNADIAQANDLDSAAYFAEEVINNSGRSLAPDYADIFEYTAVNGPNENLSEIILASQFDNNQALLGRYGNQTHMYFLSIYRNFPGMTRDLENGREFDRLKPTDFALDNFDRVNDSRFYKSIKTAYIASQSSDNIPEWTAANAPSPDLVGQPKFAEGDTAIIYLVNEANDQRFTEDYKGSFAPLMLVRNTPDGTDWGLSTYPSLSKYLDPFRTNFNDAKGTRDGILARLSETYLIAAEAYGRMEDYGQALQYINEVRQRAAYQAGEDRGRVYHLAEQVPYDEEGSTAASMTVTEAVFTPGTSEAATEIYPEGVGSKADMFVHFILNERARELLGEFHRWVDLSRTGTLLQRARAFNPEAAANIAERHILRPVPQSYLDALIIDGQPLTAAEKDAIQNPGY
ncbi:RagB/SusD family nutrient uptake outer membrane protein [Echinicola vietnamensis]|uniref:RagB/SusD family protein n=1 Tax=Echinicola vietnamensis (strain DSM 17526 / LMG 23754 / KMM 6221) TaxID=926556 RepID=L0FYR3_ECHVK|nr:RagB/SusD family nutrient uptake outer membrane protein [Echinicola vietnamensis]AGA77901.1 RagB/SusD family protein [Echinicola vietnamensis DSM 17526]